MNNISEKKVTNIMNNGEKNVSGAGSIDTLLPQNTVTEPVPAVTQNSDSDDLQITTYSFVKNTSPENINAEDEAFGEGETKEIHDRSTIIIEKRKSIQSKKDDDPHSTKPNQKPTTYLETFTHVLKGNIGVGILAMGMAYKNGGILISTILVLTIGLISWYNQYMLVGMANELRTHYKCGPMSFAQTIHFAFQRGPRAFRKSANFCRFSIDLCIIVTQLGFCCVYLMFVASSLKQLSAQYGIFISTPWFMTMVLPVFWITSLIRDLKYIAPLSTLANFSMLASLTLIMVNNVQNLPPITERSLIGEWKTIPLCFGTVMYSVEGISLVIPLQQNMKKREQFLGPCGVLNVALGFVVFLMMVIGLFGYYKHGDNVGVSLTFNLDSTSIVTQIVISALVLAILCSYALQFFVPVYVLLPWVRRRTSTWPLGDGHLYEYLFRSLLVLLTYSVVMIVPHLDLLVSLLGAVGGTLLGLIYFPMADLALRKDRKGGYRSCNVFLPILSLLVGIFGFFFGAATSLRELILAVLYDRSNES